MRRSLIALGWVAACGGSAPAPRPPTASEAPAASADPAAALWGAWALDPAGQPGAEVQALAEGPAARALGALPPSLPEQARVRAALDALPAPVLVVTPDRLVVATDGAPVTATWTLRPLGDGRSLLSTERAPDAGAATEGAPPARPVQHRAVLRWTDPDHLQLEPAPAGPAIDLVRVSPPE
jgi:hypothetical protein